GTKLHWTTPGHPLSHGTIERLHGTLQEYLHLLRIGRAMRWEEAWARAVLAYNSSLQSATGMTPLESIRAERECEELVERVDREKWDRVDCANDKATDRWDRVRAGDLVFVRDWYKRRKTDPRFGGVFVAVREMSRYGLQLQNPATGRLRIFHANENRPPAAQR
ncbi:hypothetical protein AAG570_001454, partial [Ranatra chinensis]